MLWRISTVAITIFLALGFASPALAQSTQFDELNKISVSIEKVKKVECEENYAAEVLKTDSDNCYLVGFTDPKTKEKHEITLTGNSYFLPGESKPNIGDRIFVNISQTPDGPFYSFMGFDRTQALVITIIIFVIGAVLVGGKLGARSIASLGVTSAILIYFIIPMILKGHNPVFIAALGGILILLVSIYLSHGFNWSSTTAIVGTTAGILFSVFISVLFISITKLSGFGDENSFFLSLNSDIRLNMRDVLLASFILGGVGVIDDATVSQVFVVQELINTGKKFTFKELYTSAMKVGQSHVSSLINTLFMAYASASFPLIMLFSITSSNFVEIVNMETFAEEIVRTAVGSLGLFFSVPATTFIAVMILSDKRFYDPEKNKHNHHGHSHVH